MPTATSTTTLTTAPPRKLKQAMPPEPSPVATLHTLYHRAARAFLLREVPLVHELLESAFALLHPPEPFLQQPDGLTSYRTKWDLLRITFETTIYASPPTVGLPDSLRQLLAQPPTALITAAYHRSLALFTPRAAPQKASYIPSAIILTLVYSSLKLEAPDAGRIVVEDWLASRDNSLLSSVNAKEEDSNYRKAVEAYCLCVLPKLEQWEYAREFLDYESELQPDIRESFKTSLQGLHAQAIAARLPPAPRVPPSPSLLTPRPYSPTPSSSSSSSLSSTASMHTVVPATPRPRSKLAATPSSARTASSSSASTATPRATPSSLPLTSSPRSERTQHHLPRLYPPNAARASSTPPSVYTLLKAAFAPYLTSRAKLTAISLATFVLLLVLPLLVRRRRAANKFSAEVAGGNAELVRKRLLAAKAGSGGGAGVLVRALTAVARVVGDTVRMGGSGLV